MCEDVQMLATSHISLLMPLTVVTSTFSSEFLTRVREVAFALATVVIVRLAASVVGIVRLAVRIVGIVRLAVSVVSIGGGGGGGVWHMA